MYEEVYNNEDGTINFKETYIRSMVEDILNTYRHSKIEAQIHEFKKAIEGIKYYLDEDVLKSARELEEERARDETGAYVESKREEVTAMVNEWADEMTDDDFKRWYLSDKLEEIKDSLIDVDSIEQAIEDLQDLMELAYE